MDKFSNQNTVFHLKMRMSQPERRWCWIYGFSRRGFDRRRVEQLNSGGFDSRGDEQFNSGRVDRRGVEQFDNGGFDIREVEHLGSEGFDTRRIEQFYSGRFDRRGVEPFNSGRFDIRGTERLGNTVFDRRRGEEFGSGGFDSTGVEGLGRRGIDRIERRKVGEFRARLGRHLVGSHYVFLVVTEIGADIFLRKYGWTFYVNECDSSEMKIYLKKKK